VDLFVELDGGTVADRPGLPHATVLAVTADVARTMDPGASLDVVLAGFARRTRVGAGARPRAPRSAGPGRGPSGGARSRGLSPDDRVTVLARASAGDLAAVATRVGVGTVELRGLPTASISGLLEVPAGAEGLRAWVDLLGVAVEGRVDVDGRDAVDGRSAGGHRVEARARRSRATRSAQGEADADDGSTRRHARPGGRRGGGTLRLPWRRPAPP
jgi:hypothetical protein